MTIASCWTRYFLGIFGVPRVSFVQIVFKYNSYLIRLHLEVWRNDRI